MKWVDFVLLGSLGFWLTIIVTKIVGRFMRDVVTHYEGSHAYSLFVVIRLVKVPFVRPESEGREEPLSCYSKRGAIKSSIPRNALVSLPAVCGLRYQLRSGKLTVQKPSAEGLKSA